MCRKETVHFKEIPLVGLMVAYFCRWIFLFAILLTVVCGFNFIDNCW